MPANKQYYVEAWIGGKWILLTSETRQTDALAYVKDNAGERYPLRIVRVVRTIVFNGAK